MAAPALYGASAAERVLDDVELLSRILWAPSAADDSGWGYALSLRDLCAAACVRRAWRVSSRDEAAWLPLLRAAAPKAVLLDDVMAAHRGRGDSCYRAFAQLYRLGVAGLPAQLHLQDYTLLIDVSDAEGATVACAAVPLSGLDLSFAVTPYARLEAPVAPLPDGGAAAARFLARFSAGDTDLRELRLQLLLRRADGAAALLAREQRARRFEDDPEVENPHYFAIVTNGVIEHLVWYPNEHESCRRGAATWHSSHAPRSMESRLFETHVIGGANGEQPVWWTWMLQFPANPGAVPQLSRLQLRIGRRAKYPPEPHNVPLFDDMLFSSRELAASLQGRRIADTLGAWVPF